MKNIETVVVPSSGTFEEDMRRAGTGVIYALSSPKKEFRYLLSGIGPDLNKRLERNMKDKNNGFEQYQSEFAGTEGLDVHPELWTSLIREVKDTYNRTGKWIPFGVDILSRNSVDNILNTFPEGTEGDYTIVSRKLHNLRFKRIEKWARKKGLLSADLHLKYIDAEEPFSPKTIAYDIAALGKEFLRQITYK